MKYQGVGLARGPECRFAWRSRVARGQSAFQDVSVWMSARISFPLSFVALRLSVRGVSETTGGSSCPLNDMFPTIQG
jgi:hypothetical protein